jgi:hypothetical protein
MSAFEALTSDDFTSHLSKVLPNSGFPASSNSQATSNPLPKPPIQVDGAFDREMQDLLLWKDTRQLSMEWRLLHHAFNGTSALSDAEFVAPALLRLVSAPKYRTRLLGLKDERALDLLEIMQLVRVSFTLPRWSPALLIPD